MNEVWSKYPESKPKEAGYYMTYYYNFDSEVDYYKAIWWSSDKQAWMGWRPNGGPDLSQVKGFVESTKADYYTECLMKPVKESFEVEE